MLDHIGSLFLLKKKVRQVACQLLGCEDKASSWGSFIQIQKIYA